MFHALVVIERLASSLLHFYSMKGTASDSVECKQGIYCDGVVVYLDWVMAYLVVWKKKCKSDCQFNFK